MRWAFLYYTHIIGPIVLEWESSATDVTGPGTQVTILRAVTAIARSADQRREVWRSGGEGVKW